MASSLFQTMTHNNPLQRINQIVNFMRGNNPNMVFNMLMQNNPQFANFVNQNKGKTPEQIAIENGIDFNAIKQYLK